MYLQLHFSAPHSPTKVVYASLCRNLTSPSIAFWSYVYFWTLWQLLSEESCKDYIPLYVWFITSALVILLDIPWFLGCNSKKGIISY